MVLDVTRRRSVRVAGEYRGVRLFRTVRDEDAESEPIEEDLISDNSPASGTHAQKRTAVRELMLS